jgi:ABC-type transport system involved in multi-copper enzyme maturation permease subunit
VNPNDDIHTADLSDRLGPMTVKELRQGMRRGSFVIPFLGIHLLAILTTATEFQAGDLGSTSEHPGILNIGLLAASGPFWLVVALICAVVMPLGGLTLMGGELEESNHELLLLTKLTRWQVVGGKFLTLWGLCALTFVSLLPYVVVRYLVGGIEPVQELACSGTVVALAGMVSAGAIGASAFPGIGVRIAVLALFFGSMVAACSPPLLFSANLPHGFPVFYHINALAAFVCYVLLGLALARSRVRLVIQSYEIKPSWMVVGLLFFAPAIVFMTTIMTLGFAGFVGFGVVSLLSLFLDRSPGSIRRAGA